MWFLLTFFTENNFLGSLSNKSKIWIRFVTLFCNDMTHLCRGQKKENYMSIRNRNMGQIYQNNE